MSRLTTASAQEGGASLPACSASSACMLPPTPAHSLQPQDYRALVPRSWLASRCLSFMEHGAKSPSSHQTAPARSQLVRHLLTLPPTCDQAHTQLFTAGCAADLHVYSHGAGLCPSPWPQASPPQGIWSLMSCAPQHLPLPPKLFSISHQTPPQLPSTPRDHEEVLTDPRAECWDTGTLLTHPGAHHYCHLT